MQIPTNDPSVLISALATATTNLGLVYTSSIAQSQPFDFARRISTLDHYTGGRVGWNIVTSFSDNTYRNFGHDKLIEHDLRYEIADEYVDVVYKLWEGSWDEDALVVDKQAGVHADATKIHKINHVGEHYSVEGPHFTTPSPQRVPLLFQAGSSPVGQAFSARNAEGVFISSPNPESARGLINETRELAAGYGRDPYDVKFFQGLSLVVGRTVRGGQGEGSTDGGTTSVEGVLCHILGDAGIDAGALSLDTPISELGEFRGIQGWARSAEDAAGARPPSPTWAERSSAAAASSDRRRRSPTSSRSGATPGSTGSTCSTPSGRGRSRTSRSCCSQNCASAGCSAPTSRGRCGTSCPAVAPTGCRRPIPRPSTAARSPTTRWRTRSPSR